MRAGYLSPQQNGSGAGAEINLFFWVGALGRELS